MDWGAKRLLLLGDCLQIVFLTFFRTYIMAQTELGGEIRILFHSSGLHRSVNVNVDAESGYEFLRCPPHPRRGDRGFRPEVERHHVTRAWPRTWPRTWSPALQLWRSARSNTGATSDLLRDMSGGHAIVHGKGRASVRWSARCGNGRR